MFQEVGSALQIDIQDLFQISLYDTPVYPNLENNLRRRMCDILNLEGMQWSISFGFVSLQIRRLSYCQNFCVQYQ